MCLSIKESGKSLEQESENVKSIWFREEIWICKNLPEDIFFFRLYFFLCSAGAKQWGSIQS